jgi:hypothetical protein
MTSETETIVSSPLEADFVASTYTDAQRRATQKYRTENKEKVNEQRKKYYQARKESDPNFLEYKKQKAREYYLRKKETISSKKADTPEDGSSILVEEPLLVVDVITSEPEPVADGIVKADLPIMEIPVIPVLTRKPTQRKKKVVVVADTEKPLSDVLKELEDVMLTPVPVLDEKKPRTRRTREKVVATPVEVA